MKISVLTITARDHTGFESLVRSLQKAIPELQAEGCELELVWVHRNPGDKQALYTQAMSQIEGIDFTFIDDKPIHDGPCPAGARNAGVRACTGDWIVSIDDLTVFQDHALLYHLSFARMGVDACVGTFDVQKDDGSVVPCFEADSRMKNSRCSDGRWAAEHFYGMHMAFTKEAWLKVGGFDELFDGVYGQEDCDFGQRLWRAGCSIIWTEKAKVLCYRGVKHNSTHDYLFTNPNAVPTAYVAGVPKWRNDALIQWNKIIGKVVANRREENG